MARTASGRRRAQACATFALVLLSGGSEPAQAWTSAELTAADAHVHLSPSGRALVSLTLELSVRGGWLSRFDIAGLDPGAQLDPDKPPSVLCEDGSKVAPRAELQPDGTLVLGFERARAPRRGRHRLAVLYTTQLASRQGAPGSRTLTWSMPAWRMDLADVDLWLNAPGAARLVSSEDAMGDAGVSRRQVVRGKRAVFHLHRIQLPRTVPFGFEVELSAAAATTRLGPAQPRSRAAAGPPWWLGAAVLALSWLKRCSVRARCRRRGGRPVPLIGVPAAVRLALMTAFATGGVLCYPASPAPALVLLAAVVALALDARIAPARARRSRAASPLPWLQDRFGATSWLDATTVPGAALLGSALAIGGARIATGGGVGPAIELVLLVAPLWLTATRLHTPRRVTEPAWHDAVPHTRRKALKQTAGEGRRVPDRAA